MPNAGPRPNQVQVEKFINYLKSKTNVSSIRRTDGDIFDIQRIGQSNLRVRLVEIYTVSESDVAEILGSQPTVDAIVTASAWNTYTRPAKIAARAGGVGLFGWREFMAAVHRDGDEFLDYRP